MNGFISQTSNLQAEGKIWGSARQKGGIVQDGPEYCRMRELGVKRLNKIVSEGYKFAHSKIVLSNPSEPDG